MKRFLSVTLGLALCLPLSAQLFQWTREQMIQHTAKNPFDRFADGRPKVPDALLEKARGLSMEEAWGVLNRHGFVNQYEGNWKILHPEKKLAGRAVTAQFMPLRPDLNDLIMGGIKAKGFSKGGHQWVIDMLQPGDVLVVDLFGKEDSGFVGDNLATYVYVATKNGGLVLDGGIRDLDGVYPIDMSIYCRGAHPAAIRNVMLTGVNIPVRIGQTTVMPGDVVLGDREGTYFIPPDLIQEVVDRAEETHVHDEWTKMKLLTGKYKSSEIYGRPTDPALIKEYEEYRKKKLGK
jgi:4-hydroxy-4-methyl-2-oxoglutarate aldolase